MGGSSSTQKEGTQAQTRRTQKAFTQKGPSQPASSNQETSYCEATVLTTAPPYHHIPLIFQFKCSQAYSAYHIKIWKSETDGAACAILLLCIKIEYFQNFPMVVNLIDYANTTCDIWAYPKTCWYPSLPKCLKVGVLRLLTGNMGFCFGLASLLQHCKILASWL